MKTKHITHELGAEVAEGEGDGERESQPDSIPSMEPNAWLNLTTRRSCPEPKPKVRHLTNGAIKVPSITLIFKKLSV